MTKTHAQALCKNLWNSSPIIIKTHMKWYRIIKWAKSVVLA